MSQEQDFSEPTPVRYQVDLEKDYPYTSSEADVLFFGDSFFFNLRDRSVPFWLQDTAGVKVEAYYNYHPLASLAEDPGAVGGKTRYLVFEVVERYMYLNFVYSHVDGMEGRIANQNMMGQNGSPELWRKWVFNSAGSMDYEFLVKRGKVWSDIYSFLATTRYNLFGEISQFTRVYHAGDSSMIFYHDGCTNEPGGYFYQYTDEDYDIMMKNVLELSNAQKINSAFGLIPDATAMRHP